jgi:hypothetical protein
LAGGRPAQTTCGRQVAATPVVIPIILAMTNPPSRLVSLEVLGPYRNGVNESS